MNTQGKVVLGCLLVFLLAGCASTGRSRKDMEMQELQARVQELSWQVEEKDAEIALLKKQVKNRDLVKEVKRSIRKSYKSTPRNIQRALKGGGYYDGPIDGKIGKRTRRAIRKFQSSKGLQVDGVVGRKTWKKLQQYLQ